MWGLHSSRKHRSGQSVVLFTSLLTSLLLPMVGLAIDGAKAYIVSAKLSTSCDGAALAAVRLLSAGSNPAAQTANAQATAWQYVQANFPTSFFGSTLQGSAANNTCVDLGDGTDPCNLGNTNVTSYKKRTIVVTATANVPMAFMRILGYTTAAVNARGIASRRDVRVVLCIDRSSSMSPRIADVIVQAQQFVGSFSPGRDQLGLVVFGGSAIVAYPPRNSSKDPTLTSSFSPPDTNFASATPSINTLIGELTAGSNTGTAEALYLAYMTLRADVATNPNLPNMLNVIVLFTDGLPNGITVQANTAPFNGPGRTPQSSLAAGSACPYKGDTSTAPPGYPWTSAQPAGKVPMIGFLSQWGGFYPNSGNGPLGLQTTMMSTQCTGCSGSGTDIELWMKNAGHDEALTPTMSNGGVYCNTRNVGDGMGLKGDLKQIPSQDVYGNSTTDAGFSPALAVSPLYQQGTMYSTYGPEAQNTSLVADNFQVGIASWNAAAHQAYKIWNNQIYDPATGNTAAETTPINPVIFTIGYSHDGGEVPDQVLMKFMSNTIDSVAPIAGHPNGLYFYTTTTSQVAQAFAAVASEILRLAQ